MRKGTSGLKDHGHRQVPIHPSGHVVDGIRAVKRLDGIADSVDTLTVYVNPKISSGEYKNILKLKPRRVVFNPGAENSELAEKLKTAGFEVIEACTLVMLRTEQF